MGQANSRYAQRAIRIYRSDTKKWGGGLDQPHPIHVVVRPDSTLKAVAQVEGTVMRAHSPPKTDGHVGDSDFQAEVKKDLEDLGKGLTLAESNISTLTG